MSRTKYFRIYSQNCQAVVGGRAQEKNQSFGAAQQGKSNVVHELGLPASPILFGIESHYQIQDHIRMTFLESTLSLTKG